jgi:hypothetical protein
VEGAEMAGEVIVMVFMVTGGDWWVRWINERTWLFRTLPV